MNHAISGNLNKERDKIFYIPGDLMENYNKLNNCFKHVITTLNNSIFESRF